MLDLWQNNTDIGPQAGEGHDLPASFGDTFEAAWHEGRLFGDSIAHGNAQMAGLDSYIDEVNQKSGQDIRREVYGRLDMMNAANEAVAKIRQNRPDLQIPDLDAAELERRAQAASGQAHQAYQAMADREKTFGGKVGSVLGSLAAGTTDPINLVGLAVAPEAELGVLGSAALWGGFGVASQAVNESMNLNFRNQVEPGYSASGQLGANIMEAGVGGAVLGGGFKAAANLWTRMKTGSWPTSVRDAGNLIESEANIQQSNVLPGVEGEVAHREALAKSIDDIISGRKVEAPDSVSAIPAAEPGGITHKNGVPLSLFESNAAKVDRLMDERGAAGAMAERAKAERTTSDELPFKATATEARAELHEGTLTNGIGSLARMAGYDMPQEESAGLAKRVIAAGSDDEARAILHEVIARPATIADTVPSTSAIAKGEAAPERLDALTPEARAQALSDPKNETALTTELERLRDSGQGGMIPVGVDANGEPQYRLLDEALQDARNDRDAADQIESCINPPAEEEAA